MAIRAGGFGRVDSHLHLRMDFGIYGWADLVPYFSQIGPGERHEEVQMQ